MTNYYRLLLVDDEPHIIDMVMRLLDSVENMELDIYYAYSAADAVDIIKKGRIDLLITDIQMPGMSGLELLRQVNQFWNGTKTIVLTAYPEFRYAYEVFRQYGAGYLLKTEEKEVILQTITHTLEQIGRERLASFSSDPFTDQPSVPSDGMHQDRDIPLREADLLRALHFHGSGNLLMILCAAAGCTQYASGSLQDLPSALCRLLRLHFRQMIRSSFCYQDSHGHLLFLAELSERIPEAQAADGWISGILENIQDILVSTGPRLPFLYGTSASLADVFSLYQTAMTRLSDTAQPSSASWIFCLDSSSAPAEDRPRWWST